VTVSTIITTSISHVTQTRVSVSDIIFAKKVLK
jgi:hypothetical protein